MILKEPDATTILKYKPIALTNGSFNVFYKCATNKLRMVSDDLIASTQISFIRGRFILDSVVAIHETIHDTGHKNIPGFVIKLNYEKAYDKLVENS